jgi:hypothetical protein
MLLESGTKVGDIRNRFAASPMRSPPAARACGIPDPARQVRAAIPDELWS